MSRDLEQLLHDTAVHPERAAEPAALVRRGRRRRWMRRGVAGASSALAITAVGVLVVGPGRTPAPPQIVDQPSPAEPTLDPDPSTADALPSPEDVRPSPEDTSSSAETRVEELERQREELQTRIDERVRAVSELLNAESELRFRTEQQAEDVDEELAALAHQLADARREVARLVAMQIEIERELLEAGRLEDSVAAARAAATDDDRSLTGALIAFASERTATTFDEVPFAPAVGLGLGDRIVRDVDRAALADSAAWLLEAEAFRAYTGPFSALELLAGQRPTQTLVGDHPHCASPPEPPPAGLDGHRRVSVQPVDVTSCLEWWSVDLYVGADGAVHAVTLDLYEP